MIIKTLIQKSVSIDVKDNFDQALKYMVDHGAPFNLSYETVSTSIKEFPAKALTYTGQDIIFLCYDPALERNHACYSVPLNKNITIVFLPCGSVEDTDPTNWLSMAIAHELIHAMSHRLIQKYGIQNNVNAVMDTYYKNSDWNAPDGNFAQSWALLKPYMGILFPNYRPIPTVTITRSYNSTETPGILEARNGGAVFTCKTLELPWKNNKKSVSCIPEGTYNISFTRSLKFPKGTYELQKVPNRSGIRIHTGNYAAGKRVDIEGCILLGTAFADINGDKILDITTSGVTVSAFEGFLGKKDAILIIK